MPHNTQLYKLYEENAKDAVKVVHGTANEWPSTLSVIDTKGEGTRSIAYSADGSCVAAGTVKNGISLWDGISFSFQRMLQYDGEILSLCFLPSETHLASACSDKTIKIWDLSSGMLISTLEGHSDDVNCVSATSINQEYIIASASKDATIRLWNALTGESVAELQCHSSAVFTIAFISISHRFLSGSQDGAVRLWDAKTKMELETVVTMTDDHASWVNCVSFNSDGTLLATGSQDQTVRLWNAINGNVHHILRGHRSWVISVAFNMDGSKLASGGVDYTAIVWDTNTGELLYRLEGHNRHVKEIQFMVEDGSLVITRTDDKTYTWHLGPEIGNVQLGSCVDGENPNPSNGMGSLSNGFYCYLGPQRYLTLGTGRHNFRRIVHIPEDYRITRFAFHSNRVVFASNTGNVLIIDISLLKKRFFT
ncbi:WD40-repeat-containing domain protein [Cyathus striatus]|nr:WD40-repeat-containing domain protein [Cyathus striatus]